MKTKLGQPNPSTSSYRSRIDQRDKDATIPGIKRKKLSQERRQKRTLHKKFRQKTKEEGSSNSLKAKVSGSGAHKAEDVCGRNRRKLKEVGEMNAKTEESSLSQDI